jgi:hypothetical protein
VRARGEDGVTLQDILIAMALTGILMFTLVGIMFGAWHTLTGTEAHITQSNGATLVASYFGPDVQNAITVTPNATEGGNCPSPRTVDLLLTTSSDGASSVSYYRGSGANASVMYRRTCTGGTASSPARMARLLSGAPTFTCAPACDATWDTITGTFTQNDPQDPTNVGKQYTTTIEGTRRGS